MTKKVFFAVLSVGLLASNVFGQMTFDAVKDAGTFAAGFDENGVPFFTEANMGAHTHVPVGVANNMRTNRSYFEFDLSSIPANSTVATASFEFLVVQQGGPQGSNAANFSLHRVTQAWDEGTGMGNQGDTEVMDGVTWSKATPLVDWVTLGGDFDAMTSGVVNVSGSDTYSLTSQKLIDDIQAILDGTASNYGWVLKTDTEDILGSAAQVASREAGNPAQLIITLDEGSVLLGDVNLDGMVTLLDVAPLVDRISNMTFQIEADCNEDGDVNLLDVGPFVSILTSSP